MNFSGLGGITLVVVAALWIFVFIPSWFNASAERSQEHAQVREVKRAVSAARTPIMQAPKTKVASLSEQVFRADLRVRLLSFLSWMFALTAGSLGFAVTKFAFLTPGLVATSLVALILFRGLVMAKSAQRRLLVGSIRSRAGASSSALSANARATAEAIGQVRLAQDAYRQSAAAALEWAEAREAERRAREFTVEPIPAPTYATQVGSLEAPIFAKVVDLSDKVAAAETAAKKSEIFAVAQSVDAEAITEILRRRRAANS
jgi:hypothetical protein